MDLALASALKLGSQPRDALCLPDLYLGLARINCSVAAMYSNRNNASSELAPKNTMVA
jgi:hypothetical protein